MSDRSILQTSHILFVLKVNDYVQFGVMHSHINLFVLRKKRSFPSLDNWCPCYRELRERLKQRRAAMRDLTVEDTTFITDGELSSYSTKNIVDDTWVSMRLNTHVYVVGF